ncbi:MAG TPA: tRNA (N6-isopentenyl adenosine(37)-C2)-methylthiotransferase MiaB, partial [Acidimicrobiaceae bacterium]|nr:tRNA (N6-isopentenyl adenosine(37)-C2)-methylthiotransferase MiaB [Acidimicrobiaceae bacterium]
RPLCGQLLAEGGQVPGIRRVRFTRPPPKEMRADTFAAMAGTSAVCEHLHYPLQSGSDRVLAAMHRGYTGARYLERLAEARRHIADLAVSTDIIVGFP